MEVVRDKSRERLTRAASSVAPGAPTCVSLRPLPAVKLAGAALSRFWQGRPWSFGLAVALLAGVALRLAWGADIEFKLDEAWTFEHTKQFGQESFRWVGMPTSRGFYNPGLSLWVFLVLGQLFTIHDPVDLARAVQVLNVASLGGLVLFALWAVPREEREPWLWAAALAALSPLMVLYQRKIWPPAIVPILALVMLAGWWYRQRRWGAFIWGLVGVCTGQIHMACFFLTAGFAGWALLWQPRSVRWRSYLAGCVLGLVPMLPWLYLLATNTERQAVNGGGWVHLIEGRFWQRWASEPLGISLEYSLGQDFGDFLSYPVIGGWRTYLVAVLHAVLAAAAVVLLARVAQALWQERHNWRALAIGRHSPTAFTQNAALWGFGIVLTLSAVPIHRHYLWVAFPLTFVWLARLALGVGAEAARARQVGRILLLVMCIAQGLIAAHFLAYVHVNQRTLQGDYGMPFGAQSEEERKILKDWTKFL